MALADAAYRRAKASGQGIDEAAAGLREATEAWESAFVHAIGAEDSQVVQDALDAWDSFSAQKQAATDLDGPPGATPAGEAELTYAESEAKALFPGADTLSEKEAREDAKAADEARQKALADARRKLDELRENKDHAFARLRDEYGVTTELDRERYGDELPSVRGQADAYPFGWNRPKAPTGKLVVGGAAALGIALIAGGVLLFGGGGSSKNGDSGGSATARDGGAALDARTAAPAGTQESASTPGGPALSGNYSETITVAKDPAGHKKFVAMPSQIVVNVFIVRDTQTGKITLTFNGPSPWVNLTGTAQFGSGFDSSGGAFDATGEGTVAGRPGVGVDLNGSIAAGGELQGNLTMGTNGALPTGQAIVYHIDGARQ